MRKALLMLCIVILALSWSSCGEKPEESSVASPTASDKSEEEEVLILPGVSGQTADKGEQPEEEPVDEEHEKSTIYPPSIFVIEVSGTYRQELAPGYYADYEVEFYADKLDELDLQTVSGQYTGVFWMSVTIDAGDFIKEMLKDVPVNMQFDAGSEGICDFFNVVLMNGFERHSAGGSFDIPEEGGGFIVPESGALAARGSFIAEAMSAYLDTKAVGVAGEMLEHHDDQGGSTEVDFILHVEPDPDYTKTERKVTLHVSTADGMNASFEGVLHRLPGYSEDLKAYTSQGKRGEVLDKHLP